MRGIISAKKTNNTRNVIPILVLAYNRKDLLESCVERLTNNGFTNVYVSIDGPKNERDAEIQSEMRKHLCKQLIPDKNRHGTRNQGCRVGVITGITWFFELNKLGIINEDDVEIEPKYMDLMWKLLKKHEANQRYFSISAHSEPSMVRDDGDLGLHMSPICRVHGWGSWQDRWLQHLKIMRDTRNLSPIETFQALPKPHRTSGIALRIWACRNNYMDAWDYDWNLTHLMKGVGSITPSGVYSINHGYRDDACHTKSISDRKWGAFSETWITAKQISSYEAIQNEYLLILEKCGYETEKNLWIWEAAKIMTYRPYNRFVIAPLRKLKGLFNSK